MAKPSPEAKTIIHKYTDMIDSVDFGDILWAIDQLPLSGIGKSYIINLKIYEFIMDNYEPYYDNVTVATAEAILREMDQGVLTQSDRFKIFLPTLIKAAKRQDAGDYENVLMQFVKLTTDENHVAKLWKEAISLLGKAKRYPICAGLILRGLSINYAQTFDTPILLKFISNEQIINNFLSDILFIIQKQSKESAETMFSILLNKITDKALIIDAMMKLKPRMMKYDEYIIETFDSLPVEPKTFSLFLKYPELPTKRKEILIQGISDQLDFNDKTYSSIESFLLTEISDLTTDEAMKIYNKCKAHDIIICKIIPIISESSHFQYLADDILDFLLKFDSDVDQWILALKSLLVHSKLNDKIIQCGINGLEREIKHGHFTKKKVFVRGWREMAKIIFFLTTVPWSERYNKKVIELLHGALSYHMHPLSYSVATLLSHMKLSDNELYQFLLPYTEINGITQKFVINIYKNYPNPVIGSLISGIANSTKVSYVKEMAEMCLNTASM